MGELAKCYYPAGIEVADLDYDASLAKTNELMQQDRVTIYEAAFLSNSLFIRADLVEKSGSNIRVIEVKAKSFDPMKDSFLTQSGSISSNWEAYLFDVAFQKYVIQKSFPDLKVCAHLLLVDKSKHATVDGLNQAFLIYQEAKTCKVIRAEGFDANNFGEKIMTQHDVDEICDQIINDPKFDFQNRISSYSNYYAADKKITPVLGSSCAACEFRPGRELLAKGFKSGFNECWSSTNLTQDKIDNGLLLSLWNFRKKSDFIKNGKYLLSDVTREDLEPKSKKKDSPSQSLSVAQRQWLQIEKYMTDDSTAYLDVPGLRDVMNGWKFPLHFIDFETTAVAIPFNAGRRPYEQIAFQFSHHLVNTDGSIEHKGQWINLDRGAFPNFGFIRALKMELQNDDGTIFRYAQHENTILNVIYKQLKDSEEADRDELCEWIKYITKSSSSSAEPWSGGRNMVDLRELVLKYYYNPMTKGSNSIKQVLPAVLKTSGYLQQKYSQPIYGSSIPSLNFNDHTWITRRDGDIVNPYELLPHIHTEASNELMDELFVDEEVGIADGGAAMIAYCRMQFTHTSEEEKSRITGALLRYCELDTIAMVMLYEAFKDWCK